MLPLILIIVIIIAIVIITVTVITIIIIVTLWYCCRNNFQRFSDALILLYFQARLAWFSDASILGR